MNFALGFISGLVVGVLVAFAIPAAKLFLDEMNKQ